MDRMLRMGDIPKMNDNIKQIIYEDDTVIVLHKPAGIPVQTSRIGQKDIVSILKNYRSQKGEDAYIGLVHRLDQPVEGLFAAAKTPKAAAELSGQWNSHTAEKYYRAMVCSHQEAPLMAGSKRTLTDYLLRDGRTNYSKVVKHGTAGAKKAVLRYEVLQTDGTLAELLIGLETGRHHQIRVQLANASLPLLGDRKYGQDSSTDFSLALCSVKISFIHPKSRQKMEFETIPQNPSFQLLHRVDIA